MAVPKTFKPGSTYEVELAAPVTIAGRLVRPSASRVTMSGEVLKKLDREAIAAAREVAAHDTAPGAPE